MFKLHFAETQEKITSAGSGPQNDTVQGTFRITFGNGIFTAEVNNYKLHCTCFPAIIWLINKSAARTRRNYYGTI